VVGSGFTQVQQELAQKLAALRDASERYWDDAQACPISPF
jgi:hypothetical protein